jgi:hypothetical protein
LGIGTRRRRSSVLYGREMAIASEEIFPLDEGSKEGIERLQLNAFRA